MTERTAIKPRLKTNDFREFQKYYCSFCGCLLTEDGSMLFRGIGACPRHLGEFRAATKNFAEAKGAARK
jgi:hypothetical protein